MSEVAEGPATKVSGRPALTGSLEPGDRLGNEPDDLVLADHADVEVRHEGERPPALPLPRVEHERARLGDRDRTAGERAVELVQLRH